MGRSAIGKFIFITLKKIKLNPKTNNEMVLQTKYFLNVTSLFAKI